MPGMYTSIIFSIILSCILLLYLLTTYFQMMLELEGFLTFWTLEFTQHSTLVVADHVTLQPVHVGKGLIAHFACLKQNKEINAS